MFVCNYKTNKNASSIKNFNYTYINLLFFNIDLMTAAVENDVIQ
jgi:hypothetical protein